MVEISKNKFSQIIIDPNKISLDETLSFKSLVKKYPYFQAARIIELIGLKKHNSISFNKSLKECALFSTDRSVLRDIIEFDKINTIDNNLIESEEIILSSEKTKNSFIEWLKVTKPISNDTKSDNETLIQNFIKSNPAISFDKQSSKNNLANEFKVSKKEYMTETLAKLYFEQSKFKEAIKAYEILCLKYPEKISLFADQIKKIKNNLKNKS
tara:strand:- start:508 stop:1143 length:636 start_codon:yes stop_codon:yes gene_type:complete